MGQRISEALLWAVHQLNEKGINDSRLDAEVLLAHVLGKTRTYLYLNMEAVLTDDQLEKFRYLLQRRGLREPVAYLTGVREFMSLEFSVTSDVLIPRPDTEILVEAIITQNPCKMADIGTGSGAIAISSAVYLNEVQVFAVDKSPDAMEVARQNAVKLGVTHKVQFFQGDLLQPLIERGIKDLDLVAANLPYIPSEEVGALPEDVKNYEPVQALDGGKQGLALYKTMIEQVPQVLRPGGMLLLEIGYNQGVLLKKYFAERPSFNEAEVLKDLAGMDRVISVTLI